LRKLMYLMGATVPLLASLGAQAQSTVTLFGVVDANFSRQKGGANTRTGIDSSGLQGNRWGMRGSEDLGGGIKANFVLESGFSPDTGTSGQGGRLFGRNAWVGLGGGFGEVRLGRQWTPLGGLTDEFGTKDSDILVVAGTLGAGAVFRSDNAATYITPNLGGFTGQLQYATQYNGTEVGGADKNFRQQYGLSGFYKGGPVQAGVAYIEIKDNDAAPGNQKAKGLLAYGAFDLGFGIIKAAYNKDDKGLDKDPVTIGVSFHVPIGALNLAAGYGKAKDTKGSAAGPSDDADIFTVQAVYDLSKRTALYAFFTQVSNDANAQLGYNGPAVDKSSNLFQIGMRHRF
jgi:predicted porin